MKRSSSAWRTFASAVLLTGSTAACWTGEGRKFHFIEDARAAKAAGDDLRAYGAALALLDYPKTTRSPPEDLAEAKQIVDDVEAKVFRARIEQAARLPANPEGLAGRRVLLAPLYSDPPSGMSESDARDVRNRADELIVEAFTPLWTRVEERITPENYTAAFNAFEDIPLSNVKSALRARFTDAQHRIARVHQARAKSTAAGLLGVAQQLWHLDRASQLGMSAPDSLRGPLIDELNEALGLSYRVTNVDAESKCGVSRGDVEASFRRMSKSRTNIVDVDVRVRCTTSSRIESETRTRTVYEDVRLTRYVAREALAGYKTQTYKTGGGQQCLTTTDPVRGVVKDTGRCWQASSSTETREVPVYETVYEPEEYTERVPRQETYQVHKKIKSAAVEVDVTSAFGNEPAKRGTVSARTTETIPLDSGKRPTKTEPTDAELLAPARTEALGKLVLEVSGLGGARRDPLVRAIPYDASDPNTEEALRTVHAVVGTSSSATASQWLEQRWGGKAPEGELRDAIAALKIPETVEGKPLEADLQPDYAYTPPKPVGYLHPAHGAGWLVTHGAALEFGTQQKELGPGGTLVQLGAGAATGNGVSALRLSAAGASAAILGDMNGYAVGVGYAHSLRGRIDKQHRFELIAWVGASGGITKLDGGLGPTLAKERFVRLPITLAASWPFYRIAFQAQASLEPNVLALVPDGGWRTPHVGSLWLGLLPTPWLSVLGGVETTLDGGLTTPGLGIRTGVRL